jgi:hypothetical protein
MCLQKFRIRLPSLRLIKHCLRLWWAGQQLLTMVGLLGSLFKTSAELRLENLALRQQLGVLRRSVPRQLKLTPADRLFWVWLRRVWADWKSALLIVKPATVIAWHRKGFRLFWTWKIRRGKRGRPDPKPENETAAKLRVGAGCGPLDRSKRRTEHAHYAGVGLSERAGSCVNYAKRTGSSRH